MNDRASQSVASTEALTGLALLRKPFADNQISKLPKPLKKREEMDKLPKAACKVCGGYHATSMIMHLDYVGHAALTDRLLDADPMWTWEPMAVNEDGSPHIDNQGGMWIKLTVCGVTRIGYGDAQGKIGPNAVKEVIGDALRNAAMRFGAALDLWHKGDLHGDDDDLPGALPPVAQPKSKPKAEPSAAQEPATVTSGSALSAASPPGADAGTSKPMIAGQLRIVRAKLKTAGLTDADLIAQFGQIEDLKFDDFAKIQAWLQESAG